MINKINLHRRILMTWREMELTKEEEAAIDATLIRMRTGKVGENELIKKVNEAFYKKNTGTVLQILWGRFPTFMKNPNTRDDIVQSAWEKILENFFKYNGSTALSTFMTPYALSGASLVARNTTAASSKEAPFVLETIPSKDPLPLDVVLKKEATLTILKEIESLDDMSREVMLNTVLPTRVNLYGKHPTVKEVCVLPQVVEIAQKDGQTENSEIAYRTVSEETGRMVEVHKSGIHAKESCVKAALRRGKRKIRKKLNERL